MNIELLVDSGEFWDRLRADVQAAKRAVRLQTLSFEGDRVGTAAADLLAATPAADRRVLVDSYTRFILSDRFLYAPHNLLDRGLRHEAGETRRMIQRLHDASVGVRFTNPVGPLLHRFAARNHKKLVLIDEEVAYLGGIYFSSTTSRGTT